MGWTADRERLEHLAHGIDPAVRLTTKNGWFWRTIAWILFLATFSRFKRERFLQGFATTFGPVQAYPEEWPADSVERVLVHESRHTRQSRVFGLFIHPWVGLPLMALCYLLLPLPAGLALMRAWLELDADRFSWNFQLSHGASPDDIRARAGSFAETVSGAAYAWALPGSWLRSWFLKEAEKAIGQHEDL
jgi:hypothetical protein